MMGTEYWGCLMAQYTDIYLSKGMLLLPLCSHVLGKVRAWLAGLRVTG